MKYEFYFADIKLSVVLEAEAEDIFAKLTDNEYLSLQQVVYHGLLTFLNVRTLFLVDSVESLERIKQAGKHDNDNPDGG